MSSESLNNSPASPPDVRRDRLPFWVAVLLALFLLVRLYDVGVAPFLGHKSSKTAAAQVKSSDVDDASMQDLLEADLQSKMAFLQASGKSGSVVHPDLHSLRAALSAAESLQQESGNSPGAARRLILIRALIGIAAPGSKNSPPLAADKHGLAPLDAFGSALPADLAPPDRIRYAAEARLWQTVFQGGALSPHQIAAAAAQIRHIPNIRWWQNPALIALYTQQGDLSEANRYAQQARDDALPSILPFGLLMLIRIGLTLLGIVLLLYFVIRAAQRRNQAPDSPPPADLWPTVPEAIPASERKLGAGDLMGIFVVYLLARAVIGFLLTGFSGFDIKWLPHFEGLLAPYRPALDRMPSSERMTVGIILESAVYLLSAVPPFILLWTLARRRGACLADELGWTRRHLGQNLLYGVGGFAIASALILPVSLIARWLFRAAPDPSNPVIPQLINTSGFWGPFLLIALASFGAPIVEELLFRGVFYNSVKLLFGVWPGIILTGLIFGFVHPVGIAEMLAIGTLGGVFAWMAETRKSLAPSMFAHFLQNFTTTLLLLAILSG